MGAVCPAPDSCCQVTHGPAKQSGSAGRRSLLLQGAVPHAQCPRGAHTKGAHLLGSEHHGAGRWLGLVCALFPWKAAGRDPPETPPDLLNPPPMAGIPHHSASRPRCPSSLCLPPQHSSFWGPHPIAGNTPSLQSPRLWFTPLPKQKPLPHLPTPPKARSCPGAVVPGHPHTYAQHKHLLHMLSCCWNYSEVVV